MSTPAWMATRSYLVEMPIGESTMSRFNYSDEEEFGGQFALWRANTERCLTGKNGQKALRDMREALLALPDKMLISDVLYDDNGLVCAVGAYGKYIGADLSKFDPEDATDEAGEAMGLPFRVAWSLVEMNDMIFDTETPEERYTKVLAWVESRIK